jgi:ribosomal protein S16
MKNIVRTAAVITLMTTVVIWADVNTAAQNVTDANKTIQTEKYQKGDETVKIQQENERLKTENVMAGQAIKAYEKSTTDLRWAIGIIAGLITSIIGCVGLVLTLILGFVAYLTFRDKQEYDKAVNQAKDAAKRAEDAATEIQLWKQKAQEAVAGIGKEVVKMKEIESWAKDPAKKAISDIRYETEAERKKSGEESEKERRISELWAEGLQTVLEGRYEDSYRFWGSIVSIEPDKYEAWNAWGNALLRQAREEEGAEADRLFAEAYTKYQKAVEIKPDRHVAWFNWGNGLSDQAKNKEGAEADRLFKELNEKYQKAVEIKTDYFDAWYNWGTTLSNQARKKEGAEADRLYVEVYAKYQKTVDIKPDMHEAWHNWGVALLDQSKKKEGQEKEKLLQEAKEKFSRAEQIKKGEGEKK